MLENDENLFLDDNCLIEDEYYNTIKNSIKCKFCERLLNEPMMCMSCQDSFCEKCTKKLTRDSHSCENPIYIPNKALKNLLGKLKYLCKNCLFEVKKEDIDNHLKKGCFKNKTPTKLINVIYRKKQLRILNDDEKNNLYEQKKNVNHISCKFILLIIFVLF